MSEMKLNFIGTGSAFNHKDGNNSALLEFDKTNLLLDCGHDVPKNFEIFYNNVGLIDSIWISHLHADHIGGLEEIAFKNKFLNNGKKVNLIVHNDLVDDLKSYLECTTKYGSEGLLTINDYFNVHSVDKSFMIGNRKFFIEPVVHVKNMPAFMLRGDNFIFTGDTTFIDWTQKDLNDIKYIFHDTQLFKTNDDVHTPLEDLEKLPDDIKQKIVCMHYGSHKAGEIKLNCAVPGSVYKL